MSTVNVLADPAIPKSVTSSVPRDIPDRTVPVDNAAIRKKKTSTEMERLEQDNQRMEERLNALRETLARQKEKRASANRTSVWRAGQSQRGSLSSYASDVLAKKNAAMQKTRYGGIGQEVEERRRLMDPSCKANTSTGSLGLAKSIDSLNGERRASLPTSALSPKAPSSASRKPSAPSVNPPPSVSRPARMWRVPSALDNHPPMASSPPGANYSNSRRHSEQVYTHQQDPYSNTRRGSVASVVAIPPTPPRDSEAAQDFLMQAAEEGMGDAAMFAFTSPLIYDQQESPSDSKTDSKDATEPSDSLLQGAFDEEESHRSFVSALEEWRNERAALKAQATAPTGVFRSRRVSTMLYQNAAAPPSQASENSTYVHRSLPRTLMVPSTPGQSHGDVSSLGNAPSDGEQGSMYLPIHNNEYGAPLSARPRSGSLASIGKSISNLTTSLGAVLGISPPGHAESQDVSILPITVSDHLSSHGVVTSGRESASTTPVRTPINSPRRSFAAQPPPPQLSITPVTATANSQHNSPIKHAHSPQRSSLLATSTYDEQASHNSFLSALNQWRGTQEKHTDQEANVQDSQNAQADFYGQGTQ
ncbi:hypothetical protein DFS34DRAFT_328079 [Phlyctochytrium arcticum]|nr:hypothetical protein DFS34DRAFT_328079 [Phlyctochytrium arcticum]